MESGRPAFWGVSPLVLPSRPHQRSPRGDATATIQSHSIHRPSERGVQILRGCPPRGHLAQHLNGTEPVRTHAAHAQTEGLPLYAGGDESRIQPLRPAHERRPGGTAPAPRTLNFDRQRPTDTTINKEESPASTAASPLRTRPTGTP